MLRQRLVLLLALLATSILVVLGSMLAGRYYYGSLAQSRSPSLEAQNPAQGTSAQPAERFPDQGRPPDATVAEETTAPEETTAFQAPEGTKASSTARIVCLRQDQRTPPPVGATEVLNGDVLTRVLTPQVAAQPDGVHLQIDNRLRKTTSYQPNVTPSQPNATGDDLPKGKSKHVEEFHPGIAEIFCYPTKDWNYAATYAYFEIVVGDSGYKSLELECKLGARPYSVTISDTVVGSGTPLELARKDFSNILKEGDVLEAAGYPEDQYPPVRVVRNGRVVATKEYGSSESSTFCKGEF